LYQNLCPVLCFSELYLIPIKPVFHIGYCNHICTLYSVLRSCTSDMVFHHQALYPTSFQTVHQTLIPNLLKLHHQIQINSHTSNTRW
jgi:hypothetical protein